MSALPDEMFVDPRLADAPEVRDPLTVVTDALAPGRDPFADAPSLTDDSEPWSVTDRSAAEWAIAKMAQADILFAERTAASNAAIEALEAEIERHREFIDACASERDRTKTFFSIHLTAWLRRMRQEDEAEGLEDDKIVKSVRLAHGVVKSAKRSDIVLIPDEAAFVTLHGDDSEFVRVKREPDRTAIRKHIKLAGHAPAGVLVERGEIEYSVELAPAVRGEK